MPPAQRTCSEPEKGKNQEIAQGRVPEMGWDPIAVVISAVDGENVWVSARGEDSKLYDYGPYKWGDERLMWVTCPSTLPSNAAPARKGEQPNVNGGEMPEVGAAGKLYLSRTTVGYGGLLENSAENTRTGKKIRIKTSYQLGPKWPSSEAMEKRRGAQRSVLKREVVTTKPPLFGALAAAVELRVVSFVLEGRAIANGALKEGRVDLCDANLAPERQVFSLTDGMIDVRLRPAGFKAFEGLESNDDVAVLSVQPATLVLTGYAENPDIEEPLLHSIDLTDPLYATKPQEIEVAGDRTKVTLTYLALAEFIVSTDLEARNKLQQLLHKMSEKEAAKGQ